jgi:hypothetical protein
VIVLLRAILPTPFLFLALALSRRRAEAECRRPIVAALGTVMTLLPAGTPLFDALLAAIEVLLPLILALPEPLLALVLTLLEALFTLLEPLLTVFLALFVARAVMLATPRLIGSRNATDGKQGGSDDQFPHGIPFASRSGRKRVKTVRLSRRFDD